MDLNLKYKSRKLLGGEKEKNLRDLGIAQVLRLDTKTWSIKGKIDKLDFIELKNTAFSKYFSKRIKRQTKDWEEILANHISDKRLRSRIY